MNIEVDTDSTYGDYFFLRRNERFVLIQTPPPMALSGLNTKRWVEYSMLMQAIKTAKKESYPLFIMI